MKKETKMWLELANEDYTDMKLMKKERRWRASVSFAQQVVEKIIKAYIAENTDKIPMKTHRIEKIINEAKLNLNEIGNPDVTLLSKAYEWVRYSDLSQMHFRKEKDIEKLIVMAENIYSWMLKKFENN